MKSFIENTKKSDRSPKYYQYYPFLFHNYYIDIDLKIVNKVSDASYLYYHSILLIDQVIDDNKIEFLPQIIQLQEETIKVLTSFLGLESMFWQFWNNRKREYFEANELDKILINKSEVGIEEYEVLADKKSAMGKVAIDLMSILSNKSDNKLNVELLKSHFYFSVGFQMYDDIQDFKLDVIKKQFNWAVYQLKKEISTSDINQDPDVLYKIFYVSGVGERLLFQSISYIQKSIDILESLKTNSEWLNVNIEMRETLKSYLEFTKKYVSDFLNKNNNSIVND